ncbi:uncharacterized protein LOC111709378 [Eurytemora carolleeae]|uniref:uncharacterized protein LOC111709378 n=1 Tax=Eurytemora carolleeae TaxID=1294199 RepID=UPI000C7913A4|nr:uncharacterized protein LOC111709378 [Eurytemora carolleeae]|eukprot:XP_023338803.1 uncharacterized protein LOC111709378 [Eurytemora affinis]
MPGNLGNSPNTWESGKFTKYLETGKFPKSKTLECCSALTYDNRNFKIDVSSRKYSADGGEEIYWRLRDRKWVYIKNGQTDKEKDSREYCPSSADFGNCLLDCCTYVQAAIIKGSTRKATFEFKTYKYDQIDSLLQGLYIKKESSGWSIKDGSHTLVETDDGECPSDSTNWIFNDGSTANTPECVTDITGLITDDSECCRGVKLSSSSGDVSFYIQVDYSGSTYYFKTDDFFGNDKYFYWRSSEERWRLSSTYDLPKYDDNICLDKVDFSERGIKAECGKFFYPVEY